MPSRFGALLFVLFFLPASALADTPSKCSVVFQPLHGDYVLVNNVAVTGDFVYSLDFVLRNLGLNDPHRVRALQGLKVVSLAEGASGLLPHLLDKGANAVGMDLWYHSDGIPDNYAGQVMRAYVKEHGDHLIQADARKIPMDANSVDVVLSHMLVNNVHHAKQRSIVREVLRVLKPRGEARIFGFGANETLWMTQFLETQFAHQATFGFQEIRYSMEYGGRTHAGTMNLLILRKN